LIGLLAVAVSLLAAVVIYLAMRVAEARDVISWAETVGSNGIPDADPATKAEVMALLDFALWELERDMDGAE
jgi:hypothetical protein